MIHTKPAGYKQKKSILLLPMMIIFTLTILLNGCSCNNSGAQVITEGESLVIPINELTNTVRFYPVEVNGVSMEVIAVLDSDNNIRTAFNTCQICYNSGKGYYVQSGDKLICQNCGNEYTIDQIEVETGGCNPWPIFEENKTVTEDSVSISYEFLYESRKLLEN